MTPTARALLLGALHLAIAGSIGGKFLLDRLTRPRVWLRTVPVDPDLPIRGRYVSLRVEVPVEGAQLPAAPRPAELAKAPWRRREWHEVQVVLRATPRGLVAEALPAGWPLEKESVPARLPEASRGTDPGRWVVLLAEPLACFIPEHIPDPSVRKSGEELWVEATLPRKGPLRPIRLAVRKDGRLAPLDR